MAEYWIWSNQHGAWWAPAKRGYTNLLHEAGRYPEYMVTEILAQCNLTIAPTAWPDEVAIEVTNNYLPAKARELIDSLDIEPGVQLTGANSLVVEVFDLDFKHALGEEDREHR